MIDTKPVADGHAGLTAQTPAATRMRAIVQDTYAESEAVLSLQDIIKLVVKDDEVLVHGFRPSR